MQQLPSTPGPLARLWHRLWRRSRPAFAASYGESALDRFVHPVHTAMPDELYAQRERLFACALQLLDDPQAAQQVVAEALAQTALAMAQGGSERLATGRLSATVGEGQREAMLTGLLDKSVVRLALLRLRVTPMAMQLSDGIETRTDDGPPSRTAPLEVFDGATTGPADSVGQLERIGDALNSLPAEIRAVIALIIMQGRTLSATADLLGISPDACSFFLGHGRKLLRRALQRDLLAADDVLGAGSILLQPRELNDLHGSKKATARA